MSWFDSMEGSTSTDMDRSGVSSNYSNIKRKIKLKRYQGSQVGQNQLEAQGKSHDSKDKSQYSNVIGYIKLTNTSDPKTCEESMNGMRTAGSGVRQGVERFKVAESQVTGQKTQKGIYEQIFVSGRTLFLYYLTFISSSYKM